MEEKLSEPIAIAELAMSSGLNYGEMQGLIANQDKGGSDKQLVSEARRNVVVLRGIRKRLTTVRTNM